MNNDVRYFTVLTRNVKLIMQVGHCEGGVFERSEMLEAIFRRN